MGSSFNHIDFGFCDQTTFERALTCGPIVRFEIRKHKGKVNHAISRLAGARKTLKTEIEQAMGSTNMTEFIEGWVEQHEKEVAHCEARLAFLRAVMKDNF